MAALQIHVLGSPSIKEKGETIRIGCRKTEALIYYLAVNKEASRDQLINLLWPEKSESSGRKNLRQALYQIRQLIDEPLLISDGQYRIILNQEIPIEVDWDYEDLLIADKEEFLAFFYLKACPEFELWIDRCRKEQKTRSLNAIRTKLAGAKVANDMDKIKYWIQVMIHLEPYSDGLIMEAMQTYVDIGHMGDAVKLYNEYRQLLMEELDETPGDTLKAYYKSIIDSSRKKAGGTETELFFGRKEELQSALDEIMHFSIGDYGKSVILIGESGVGKSTMWKRLLQIKFPQKMVVFSFQLHPNDRKYSLKLFGDICREIYLRYQWGEISLTQDQITLLDFLFFDLRKADDFTHDSPEKSQRETISSKNFENHLEYLQMEHLIMSLFHDISEKNRIVLFLDDLQWLDSESLQLLYRLIADFSGNWLQTIIASRSHLSFEAEYVLMQLENLGRLKRIPLKPFNEEEIQSLLQDYFPENTGELNAEELYRRTEGNTLMLMDLLTQFQKEGKISGKIPARTNKLLQMRMRTLSKQQIRVLSALAFFNGTADFTELCRLLQLSHLQMMDELNVLRKKQWIRENKEGNQLRYEFRRQIYLEFICSMQSEGDTVVWKQLLESSHV